MRRPLPADSMQIAKVSVKWGTGWKASRSGPSSVRRRPGDYPPATRWLLQGRRGEGVSRARALHAEDERELALGGEAALGGAEGRAGLREVQRAEHVLAEEAVLAGHRLRLLL